MIAKEYSVNGDKVWKAISRGIENARALWTDEIGTKYFGPAYDAENPLTPSQIIPMIADRIRQSTTAPDPA